MIEHIAKERYTPEELKPTKEETHTSKNNILVIGPIHKENLLFPSQNLAETWKKLGYDVKYFSPNDLDLLRPYRQQIGYYPLNNLLQQLESWKPQFIFVEECNLYISNSTSIPVFYHQREFRRPPKLRFPTVAYFYQPRFMEFFYRFMEKPWMAQTPHKKILPLAYNPDIFPFTPHSEKKYKGLSFMEFRETIEDSIKQEEISKTGSFYFLQHEVEKAKQYIDHIPITRTDQDFRESLREVEIVFIPLMARQYVSRAIIEAMGVGAQVVLKLENEEHEEILEEVYGLENQKHYLGIKEISELQYVKYDKDIVKQAYEHVLNNHTYMDRAKQVIQDFKEIK